MERITRRAAIGAIGSIAATAIIAGHAAKATATATPEAVAWDRLMIERDRAEAAYRNADRFYNPETEVSGDHLDAVCEQYCNLEDRLMAMPAPHHRALRWKLEKLLEVETDHSTPSWAWHYVKQTAADIQRLLVEG